MGGAKGSGFSVQADPFTTMMLPDILENLAKRIRAEMAEEKG